MGQTVSSEHQRPSLKERAKKYLVYALVALACAFMLYIFVWFGTQLGLLN